MYTLRLGLFGKFSKTHFYFLRRLDFFFFILTPFYDIIVEDKNN